MKSNSDIQKMQPFMSPLTVWAFAVGTSVGWGSLVAIFVIGITACFVVGIVNFLSGSVGFEPRYAPDGLPLAQIARIASISPRTFGNRMDC